MAAPAVLAVLAALAGAWVGAGGALPPSRWGWLLLVAAIGGAAVVATVRRALRAGIARNPAAAAPLAGAQAAAAGPAVLTVFDNGVAAPGACSVAGGLRLLAGQVVPVWHRQLEASQAEAEQGLNGLLESFNQISSGLAAAIDAAAQGQHAHLGAGAADEIVERRQDLVDRMLAPTEALRALRAEVQQELQILAEGLVALRRGAKEIDALARHARLVAMNASIEAHRAGQSQGGFGAVAREVLNLSTGAAGNAQRLQERLSEAEARLGALRNRLELDTGNAETLALELQQHARALVVALVGDMGEALAGSRELRETSEQLRAALDDVFVGFQFQDRFAQMLGSVLADMDRFVEWLDANRGASHADAVAWLKRLDDSYTMEQQRSRHHGTAHVGIGPTVEFF